jgi:hypothetical protein
MAETFSNKSWALASLSVSNMRALPDHATELVSQVMMGTPLQVLDFRDKFYYIQTPEGYLGWLDAKGLELKTEQEMETWKKSNRFFYNRISGYAYNSTSKVSDIDIDIDIVTDLVLGDLFETEPAENGFLKIRLPDGRCGYVPQNECISFERWISIDPDVESVISFARRMMGFPYLWGGASTKAVDCSGFTKLMYYTQGIILARDASQQARYGKPVDISDIGNLQHGDLLFFGSTAQKIHHVGIHLGNGDFIHSSGRVHISSIVPGDPKHDPNRNFVAARRIMNSLDTEGIIKVRSHPWYNSKFNI